MSRRLFEHHPAPEWMQRLPEEADDALIRLIRDDCESPIENAFALALIAYWLNGTNGYVRIVHRKPPSSAFFLPDPEGNVRRVGLTIWPQAQIDGARHDFMLTIEPVDPQARPPFGEAESLLIVECDGHDFHERTKEQARRDRGRDRHIQGMGGALFRFTGSEIHADPYAVAREALTYMDSKIVPVPFS